MNLRFRRRLILAIVLVIYSIVLGNFFFNVGWISVLLLFIFTFVVTSFSFLIWFDDRRLVGEKVIIINTPEGRRRISSLFGATNCYYASRCFDTDLPKVNYYLKCAINPSGDCETCPYFKQD